MTNFFYRAALRVYGGEKEARGSERQSWAFLNRLIMAKRLGSVCGCTGFAFFKRSGELSFLANLGRLLHQELEAHQRQRLIHTCHHSPYIKTSRSRTREQSGINGWLKERKLAENALDVEAIADLE